MGPSESRLPPEEVERRRKERLAEQQVRVELACSEGHCGTCKHLAGNGEIWEGKEQWGCSFFPTWIAVVRHHHCGQWVIKE